MGSRRWIETGMPEPRTKYGPFCARVGIASVAKRERMGERLEWIFFFFVYAVLDIKSETFFFIKKKKNNGDVEVRKVMKRKSEKKSGLIGGGFFRKQLL